RDGELFLLQCRPITTLAQEFPVTWDDPEDANLTWEREDAHFDRVLGPLAIDFIRNGPDYGIRKRFVEIGFPMLVRHIAFNGRFYASSKPLVPADVLPAKLTEMLALRRRVGRTLRARWDDEFVPELERHYEWMRRLDFGAMAAAAAADAWLELWRRQNRIWTIHFIVTGSSYPVMEELAQAFEQLVGGNGGEALVITQGLAPTLQRLERDLHALAGAARAAPAVHAAIIAGERSADVLAGFSGGDRFREVVATALRAGPLTEEHNYWIDRVAQAHARRLALAVGERLVRERVLEAADEVFLLYVAEIADALRASRPLGHLVARRRRELATWRRANPP